jgi:hypothetical protein
MLGPPSPLGARRYELGRERAGRAALRGADFDTLGADLDDLGVDFATATVDFETLGADFAGRPRLVAATDLVGTDFSGTLAAFTSGGRVNCRTVSATPPTTRSTGHSTSPTAPNAARVSAAAGVERLPLLTPLRIPSAVPRTPPMTPLTAAPDTAPAAAVVALIVPVTPRMTPWTNPMIDSLRRPNTLSDLDG